jgi:hypothetical protein
MAVSYTGSSDHGKTGSSGGTGGFRMADKERLKRQTAKLKAEIEAMQPVVTAAIDLVRSGYDGPFMGSEVEPLFNAVAKYEKATGIKTPAKSVPPAKLACGSPKGCINSLLCNLSNKCIYPAESNPGHMTNE